jgi:hypothetical protein
MGGLCPAIEFWPNYNPDPTLPGCLGREPLEDFFVGCMCSVKHFSSNPSSGMASPGIRAITITSWAAKSRRANSLSCLQSTCGKQTPDPRAKNMEQHAAHWPGGLSRKTQRCRRISRYFAAGSGWSSKRRKKISAPSDWRIIWPDLWLSCEAWFTRLPFTK